MKRWELLNQLIANTSLTNYLEIGVNDGVCFDQIVCDNKVGVDPAAKVPVTHPTTSDIFFRENRQVFDVIFIDGLHYSDQVDRDIANAIACMSPYGYIVLHDTNPQSEESQSLDPNNRPKTWNGDVWRSVVRFIAANHLTFFVATLDTDEGLTIIRRGSCECNFTLPDKLTYQWLEANRKAALNLIEPVAI